MNKLWILVPVALAIGALIYFVLSYFGLLSVVTGGFNWLIAQVPQVTGFLSSINTFIKENPWITPLVGVCGTLSAAGIVNWVKNRSQQKIVSSIQNDAVTTQSNLTRAYNQSISSVKTENSDLQKRLVSAEEQLSKVPDIEELQRLFIQSQDRARSLADQVVMLQNQVKELKMTVVPVTVYK
jgi:hypothetical protein